MSASLSTHVLDTGRGEPARGVRVELRRGGNAASPRARRTTTAASPRSRASSTRATTRSSSTRPSPFFRRVELEVELDEGHYHVPLLVSPYGCASYRGS